MTLTATVANTNASRQIPVTVVAAPEGLDTDYTAGYLWTHFAAEGGYEKIFYGHSEDGLHWSKLNDNEPILANLGGDLGVRDPHLVRAPEGDKYWIIGTDLHAEGGGAGGSGWDQLNASQNLVVWESTDLVNWSDQRIVFAGLRPGRLRVGARGDLQRGDRRVLRVLGGAGPHRQRHATTGRCGCTSPRPATSSRFTEPEIWASLNEQGRRADRSEHHRLDHREGGRHLLPLLHLGLVDGRRHRPEPRRPVDHAWSTRRRSRRHGLRTRMEGLTVYQLPDGRWAVMGDDSGYYGHIADTLESLEFRQLSVGTGPNQYSFDQRFRHGSVLRLSAAEEARLLEAYGDSPVDPEEPEEPQEGPIAEYTFDDGTLDRLRRGRRPHGSGTAAVGTEAVKGKALRLTAHGRLRVVPDRVLRRPQHDDGVDGHQVRADERELLHVRLRATRTSTTSCACAAATCAARSPRLVAERVGRDGIVERAVASRRRGLRGHRR